jgi:lysophospholipase L1-like esterase
LSSGNPRRALFFVALFLLGLSPLQPLYTRAASAGPSVIYVALGDSLTFGFGADHPMTESYPALLARRLPSGSHLHNLAIPGITIADALDQELPTALAAHPTLVTVWLGYNDVTLSTSPASYSTSLEHMLKALRARHARIFVANMPNPRIVPVTALNPDDHLARTYNALIAAIAVRYGATVVDVYASTRAVWGKPGMVSDDDLHLTTRGYAALAQIFLHTLRHHGAV